jgi:hypothetical protein
MKVDHGAGLSVRLLLAQASHWAPADLIVHPGLCQPLARFPHGGKRRGLVCWPQGPNHQAAVNKEGRFFMA